MAQSNVVHVDFASPPRMTGNMNADFPAFVEYVWALYRAHILENGLVKSADLTESVQTAFTSGGIIPVLPSYTVAEARAVAATAAVSPSYNVQPGALAFITDEAGGSIPACLHEDFVWYRLPDKAPIE